MLKKILFLALVSTITAGLTVIIMYDHLTGSFPFMSPGKEDVIETSIYSAILNENRNIIITLPSNYDSTKKYPVMYILDGSSDDETIARVFNVLSANNHVPPVILVGIPNISMETRQRDLTPPYLRRDIDESDSPPGDGDKFLSFMETELFPFIEKSYPASHERLLSGFSRGGLLVMHSLLSKPYLFGARFCYSAPFWRQDEAIVLKVQDFISAQDTLKTFLYMSVGDRETTNIKSGFESMKEVFTERIPYGFILHTDYTKNADHQHNVKNSVAIAIGKWGQYIQPKITQE